MKYFEGAFLGLVLLLGLFAPVLHAETLDGAKERYLNQKEKYQNARGVYLDAREDYKQAKEQWDKFKNNESDLLPKAKRQIGTGLDLAVEYLNGVNTLLDWAQSWDSTAVEHKDEINGYIAVLQEYRSDLNNATTKAQVFEVSAKIRNEWNSIRADVKRITGGVLAAKIKLSLDQGQAALNKIDGIIEARRAYQDVSTLEALYTDANVKYARAEADYESAKNIFASVSDVPSGNALYNQGHDFLKSANQYLTGLYKDLKEVQRELTGPYMQANASIGVNVGPKDSGVNGTGFIKMQGIGTATLVGEFTRFEASTSGYGAVTVTDRAKDSVVNANGFGNVTENADGSTTYEGEGTLTLTGSDATVVVGGASVTVFAQGTGTASMSGTGTYETGKCPTTDNIMSCVTIVGPRVLTPEGLTLNLG